MTNIGIIRKVDSLGRVVIPKEYRKIFGMETNQIIEIIATTEGLVIRNPVVPSDYFIKSDIGKDKHEKSEKTQSKP